MLQNLKSFFFPKKIALQTVWQKDKQRKETERQEERRERERKGRCQYNLWRNDRMRGPINEYQEIVGAKR